MITDKSIEIIAEQLGMATEQIYEIFVAAQPVIAVLQLLCIGFVILLAIIGYCLPTILKWDCEPSMLGTTFAFVGMSVTIVIYECMRCYFLPEYSAIIKLMKLTFGGI